MSFQASRYVRKLRGVSKAEKLVLFVLAEYHNFGQNAAWPSLDHLAEDCEMSERNLRYCLDRLIAPRDRHPRGILKRQRAHIGRGGIYEFGFVGLEQNAAKKAAKKAANGDIAIRNNSPTVLETRVPLPLPLQGEDSRPPLTSRDRRYLNKRMWELTRDEKMDQTAAFETACEQLLIPRDQALESLKGTAFYEGIMKHPRPPRRAAS